MTTTTAPREQGYTVQSVRVQLVRERTLFLPHCTLPDAASVARLCWDLIGDADREHFLALALDTKHAPLAVHVVSVGDLSSAPVHPREVFRFAILTNAACVIAAHNHPSGDAAPSQDDLRITQHLAAAGRLLGIELLDHLILGEPPFYLSLRGKDPNAFLGVQP